MTAKDVEVDDIQVDVVVGVPTATTPAVVVTTILLRNGLSEADPDRLTRVTRRDVRVALDAGDGVRGLPPPFTGPANAVLPTAAFLGAVDGVADGRTGVARLPAPTFPATSGLPDVGDPDVARPLTEVATLPFRYT